MLRLFGKILLEKKVKMKILKFVRSTLWFSCQLFILLKYRSTSLSSDITSNCGQLINRSRPQDIINTGFSLNVKITYTEVNLIETSRQTKKKSNGRWRG